MTVTAGPDQITTIAAEHPTDLFFALPAPYLPQVVVDAGHVLYATSLFAAMLAFHATVARYTLTLAREGVLPRWLAVTRADEVPVTASLSQSLLAGAVLAGFVTAGLDPTMDLFFFGTVSGGLGVLALMTITAIAVVRYFTGRPHGQTWWRRTAAPLAAALLLGAVLAISVAFFGDLLGTTDPARTWAPPAGYLLTATAGTLWAIRLRRRRPDVYAVIGSGQHTHRRVPAARHRPPPHGTPPLGAAPLGASSPSRPATAGEVFPTGRT